MGNEMNTVCLEVISLSPPRAVTGSIIFSLLRGVESGLNKSGGCMEESLPLPILRQCAKGL